MLRKRWPVCASVCLSVCHCFCYFFLLIMQHSFSLFSFFLLPAACVYLFLQMVLCVFCLFCACAFAAAAMGITPIFDPTHKEVPTMKLDISDKRTFLTTYACAVLSLLPSCPACLSAFLYLSLSLSTPHDDDAAASWPFFLLRLHFVFYCLCSRCCCFVLLCSSLCMRVYSFVRSVRPPPKGAVVQCHIQRSRNSLAEKLYPLYELYLEDGNSFLMAAKKKCVPACLPCYTFFCLRFSLI